MFVYVCRLFDPLCRTQHFFFLFFYEAGGIKAPCVFFTPRGLTPLDALHHALDFTTFTGILNDAPCIRVSG